MVGKKAAFSLIELIFAIVVIAIVIMSLPMMNQSVNKGIDSSIAQEAIFAASTKLNEALSATWDDNSVEPGATYSLARVIDIGQRCNNIVTDKYYRRKQGHIVEIYHRRCLESNTTTAANSNTNSDITSLDDMKVTTPTDLFLNMAASAEGYKKEYTYTTDISNSNVKFPSNLASNLNIKKIIVEITNKNSGDIVTSLKAYSFNIGEVDIYTKVF